MARGDVPDLPEGELQTDPLADTSGRGAHRDSGARSARTPRRPSRRGRARQPSVRLRQLHSRRPVRRRLREAGPPAPRSRTRGSRPPTNERRRDRGLVASRTPRKRRTRRRTSRGSPERLVAQLDMERRARKKLRYSPRMRPYSPCTTYELVSSGASRPARSASGLQRLAQRAIDGARLAPASDGHRMLGARARHGLAQQRDQPDLG